VIALATAGLGLDTAAGDARVWPLYVLALFIVVGQSVLVARPSARCWPPA